MNIAIKILPPLVRETKFSEANPFSFGIVSNDLLNRDAETSSA